MSTFFDYDVVIIGAGMCGISCGAGLKTYGVDNFIILEKGNVVNNFWKNHTFDRMSLHTPYHDLPFDGGLVYNYPQMKNKHQMTQYMQQYADKYELHKHIKFNTEVTHISKDKIKNEWIITTKNNEIYKCVYLCVATSALCKPKIPKSIFKTMHNFQTKNGIIHSMQYKNGQNYANQNVLVVGNGDSAFEIAVDLVSFNANKVTLISPIGRHVVRLSSLNKSVFAIYGILKKLGIMDIIIANSFHLTPKHKNWNLDFISLFFYGFDMLSIDLTRFGIPKPSQCVFKENVNGNLMVLDWQNEHSCVDLILRKRVECIHDYVDTFESPNIIHLKNKVLTDYDAVILCTGYCNGLEEIFDSDLYTLLFDEKKKPTTNGMNQSIADESIFFLGLLGDYSVFGGLSNGWWGWHCARTICKDKDVYSNGKSPSMWNPYTIKRMAAFSVCIGGLLGIASYFGRRAWKQRQPSSRQRS